MSVTANLVASKPRVDDSYWLDIVSSAQCGKFVIALPPRLKPQQAELESLLSKVFSGRPIGHENLALAQQMSLNWCISKCRQLGISFEDSWTDAEK
jgi:hypothetical protein